MSKIEETKLPVYSFDLSLSVRSVNHIYERRRQKNSEQEKEKAQSLCFY
jgi:hypothetical protein